jgi:hypothetical protein
MTYPGDGAGWDGAPSARADEDGGERVRRERPKRGPTSGSIAGEQPRAQGGGKVGGLKMKDPSGRLIERDVRFADQPDRRRVRHRSDAGLATAQGEPAVYRTNRAEAEGRTYTQRIVEGDHVLLEDCAPLFNEIQIALHLAWSFGDAYPPELARIVGYNDWDPEPFILVEERGRPMRQLNPRLVERQEDFEVSLMRTLSLLEAVRVVHRAITPDHVLWDGSGVQLVDFSQARFVGEPCGPAAETAWAAPEARRARCVADPAEDLWSAGLVILHTINGPLAPGLPGRPDLRNVSAALDRLLDGVFERPVDRPPLDAILADLSAEHLAAQRGAFPTISDAAFLEGLRVFAQNRPPSHRRREAGGPRR